MVLSRTDNSVRFYRLDKAKSVLIEHFMHALADSTLPLFCYSV